MTTLLITEPSVRARLARSSASSDVPRLSSCSNRVDQQAGDADQRVADDDGQRAAAGPSRTTSCESSRRCRPVRGWRPIELQGREEQDGEDQQERGDADEPQRPAHERARGSSESPTTPAIAAAVDAAGQPRAQPRQQRDHGQRASTYFQSAWPSNTRFHIEATASLLSLRRPRVSEAGSQRASAGAGGERPPAAPAEPAAAAWRGTPRRSLRFSSCRLPPCASAICRLRTSPMPEPPGLVVKNGTNRLPVFPSPGPRLRPTVRPSTATSPARAASRRARLPPVSLTASTALRIRLISSCSS